MESDAIASRRRRGRDGVRRFGSPVGLAGVLLCVLLPFLSASCSGDEATGADAAELRKTWRVTWTGTDILTGGRPDVAWADDATSPPRRLSDAEVVDLLGDRPSPLRPQPFGWAALVLVVAALAVAASGVTRRRAAITAGLALTGGLALLAATLLAREQATELVAEVLRRGVTGSDPSAAGEPIRSWEYYPGVRDLFRFGIGFWLATGGLALVGMTNVALAVPGRSPDPP
ncbi:hypothetical protein [Virgisporangium aurantiacum]|uniref:Uncharacterized protein n=1 Tax=Virgisporangium aurantiacum TaxID=175570 RepID=A0A8J3Z0C0_9ACTN|nr:hypothetical protein [Virgisporangium aurantiacum]GIJ54959.1 hypothetical protein Vau01_024750 [Virgisporangium aurantiacum]